MSRPTTLAQESTSPARRFSRPPVNITPVERAGRVLVGAAAVGVAIVLLLAASSWLAVALEVLLAAAGLDLVITGALGHCPLYHRLGHMPRSLRGTA
ncbi:MAG: DUF2892 domain-containing protein [Actinobacteria bacterium]|nr:DUF2892 domain-containing protein [Actinomycetota bacterium]